MSLVRLFPQIFVSQNAIITREARSVKRISVPIVNRPDRPIRPDHWTRPEVDIDFASFFGTLKRSEKITKRALKWPIWVTFLVIYRLRQPS